VEQRRNTVRIITTLLILLFPALALGQPYPSPTFNVVFGGTVTSSNAALKALPAGRAAGTTVSRSGFTTAGDGGAANYTWSTSACSLNLGAGDNGSQVAPTTGVGCWLKSPGEMTPLIFGAKGDSSTDDSAAIAATFAACTAVNGGEVVFPPTGKMYVVLHADLITAANAGGCGWKGKGGHYWPANFYDNTPGDWSVKGAWIWCQDTANACAEMSAPGQSVIGLNFWQTHPTPSSTTCSTTPCPYAPGWTPTTYPPVIKANATTNFFKIQDNMIVNAYDCLDIGGSSSGVANMYSDISNNYLGCFHKDVKFNLVDNTITWDKNHEFLLWYQGSTQVFGYIYGGAGGLGWDVNYLANIQVSNSEITWKRLGILLTDGTVTNGFGSLTFAGANWQVHGLQFNEVCRAMAVAATTTHFGGGPAGNAVGVSVFDNTIASVDTQFSGAPSGGSPQCASVTPNLFDFASDNVSVVFSGLNIGYANSIINIGAGAAGFVEVIGMRAQQYSVYTAGLPAYKAQSNAILDLIGDQFSTTPATGAGPYTQGGVLQPFSMAGAGNVNGPVGTSRQITFGTNPAVPTAADFGSSYRWGIRTDASAESGSNLGSNLNIDRYNDNGTYVDTPLSINRATGNINLNEQFYHLGIIAANLPVCGAPQTGATLYVTDLSVAPTYLATVGAGSGGGNIKALVICNGSIWQAH
jgi:hypothetical protein